MTCSLMIDTILFKWSMVLMLWLISVLWSQQTEYLYSAQALKANTGMCFLAELSIPFTPTSIPITAYGFKSAV